MTNSQSMKKVNLFILGVQKAGTTALAEFISAHPDVCLVKGKEAHVFDDPDYHRSADKAGYAQKKYDARLSHYNGEKYLCDATPITLLHPRFIAECVSYNPDAKFLVMLRDPVARAYSHYQMSKRRGLEELSPLRAFLTEPWRMKNWKEALPYAPFEHAYRDFSYLLRGCYKRQLAALYDAVPANQVLLHKQEDLIRQHHEVMAKTFSFLALPQENIAPKQVFEGDYKESIPWAAQTYARLYFLFHGEHY
ncbi:sulfotransferase family protein [Alteromonas halophila]|nr:sulfotransferase [Alteromonas halophila]